MFNQQLFGRKVRERRKIQGLTQDALGEVLGVSPQAVSKWEQGDSMPDLSLFPSLCRVLGASADHMLGIEGVGIENLSRELSDHINRQKGGERQEILIKVLPWIHRHRQEKGDTVDPQGSEVHYGWDERGLDSLQLWSDRGVACTILSGVLKGKDPSNGEKMEMLRILLEPNCWTVAHQLLSGPKTKEQLMPSDDTEPSSEVELTIDQLITAGLVVQDRSGYRLDEQNGVLLTALVKAIGSLPKLNGISQLWHTSGDKRNQ